MEAAWLVKNNIISETYLKNLIYSERKIKKVRSGGGVGKSMLVAYDSIPDRYKQKIQRKLGANPYDIASRQPAHQKVEVDYNAFEFFSNYRYADGSPIPTDKQDNITLWANNAAILNSIKKQLNTHTSARASHGRRPLYSEFYAQAVVFIKDSVLCRQFEHNLPTNPRRLRQKLEDYIKNGYESLVKRYKGNQNARKVDDRLETLIIALHSMPNKPFAKTVHQMYHEFVAGGTAIIDKGTGEIFQPEDFKRNDVTIQVSEATVWNYINKPSNRILSDRLRNDAHYYRNIHEPHHHRQAPEFSLSKVSMDDRDIPNSDVKAYYAYDVASGCVIGRSYSKDKDMNLVLSCFANMFSFLDKHQMGTPLEIEVEQHLMNRLQQTILAEGSLFKYIRWCAPGNSQEKWAETGNRLKKYGAEKRNQEGIGRFYARSEANRPKQVNEWDDTGMRVKDRKRTIEKAIAEDIASINEYNNEEHPRYKGKTRLQVLTENVNPQVPRIDRALTARLIGGAAGYKTTTTIRRSQYVTVQYEKYQLPHPVVLQKLAPNNYTVEAYYLPAPDGDIASVYLYQNGKLICECSKIEKYSTAKAEWDEADELAFTNQSKYVEKHRKLVKDGKNNLPKLEVLKTDPKISADASETVEVFVAKKQQPDFDDNDDFETDINSALNDF